MKVLIIYNLIPENVKIYQLDIPEGDTLSAILKCHGVLGNQSDLSEEVAEIVNNWLPVFLEQQTPIYDEESKATDAVAIKADMLIYTGFIL